MENRREIEQELQEMAPTIAALRHINPYRVPAGYFDSLAEAAVRGLNEPVFLPASANQAYQVPSGYFEGLAADVLGKIKAGESRSELDTIAPLLVTISRENVYTVPAGYFEEADFTSKAIRKEAKVFSLRIARRFTQYAAAAVMAGILVTGAFLFTNNNGVESVSSGLDNVSAADLEKYMDNPEHFVAAPAATSMATEQELEDVRTNIHTVSDEELTQYLKENAEGFESVVSAKE